MTLPDGLELVMTDEGLTLTDGKMSMCGDLTRMIPRIKKGIIGTELLVRAARLKDMSGMPVLIDATAGMGEDSLLLAAAGFNVTLCEYNPVIAALLKDTLRRASSVPDLSQAVSRMTVFEGDSIGYLRSLCDRQDRLHKSYDTAPISNEELPRPDVIYLDPMFPERTKNAMIKKKFQLLQQLELPCSNENELLDAAMAAHPHKIVIKRPVKGPYLAGIKPAYSISGKAVRYDCLLLT